MVNKLITICLTLIVFNSCSANKNIIGQYSSLNNPNSAKYLNLKADSTFLYKYQFIHFYEHSTGKYKILNKNTILLNSNIHFVMMPLKVVENTKSDSLNIITVKVNIKNGEDLANYNCYFVINGHPYFFSKKPFRLYRRCDSLSSVIINEPIKTISFAIDKNSRWTTKISSALETDVYNIKAINTLGNRLICTIDCDELYFFYKPFNNEKCKFKKNKIGFYLRNLDRWDYIHKL